MIVDPGTNEGSIELFAEDGTTVTFTRRWVDGAAVIIDSGGHEVADPSPGWLFDASPADED